MLTFRNVSFQYDEDDVAMFDGLSFQVERGEFVSVIGASGCGKSTILRLTNRSLTPSAGEILVNGQDIRETRPACGYMPQSDLLFPWLTAAENVALPLKIRGTGKKDRLARADELLGRVGLRDVKKKYPRELSGGMRQRVAFARTLAAEEPLLLLDEPFSALDSITRMSMQEWLREQWLETDLTILFVTHDVEEALFLSQKVLVITGHPVKEAEVIEVPLPRERTREMLAEPALQELKTQLIGRLRKEPEL